MLKVQASPLSFTTARNTIGMKRRTSLMEGLKKTGCELDRDWERSRGWWSDPKHHVLNPFA